MDAEEGIGRGLAILSPGRDAIRKQGWEGREGVKTLVVGTNPKSPRNPRRREPKS